MMTIAGPEDLEGLHILVGRTLQTVNGAPFDVVKATKKSIVIHPHSSRRNYTIRIDEFAHLLRRFADGAYFPKPSELRGIDRIAIPYAWALLRASVDEHSALLVRPKDVDVGKKEAAMDEAGIDDDDGTDGVTSGGGDAPSMPRMRLTGRWRVDDMPDLFRSYLELTDNPHVSLQRESRDRIAGTYAFGVQEGVMEGMIQTLGNHQAFVFSMEGTEGGEPEHMAGVATMGEKGVLRGTFIGHDGSRYRFVWVRQRASGSGSGSDG
jgi:hypothetical protein